MRTGVRAIALATLARGARRRAGRGAAIPVTRIEAGWHSFKGGYAADSASGSRLVSGLGSNRYDFYRVALDEFLAHPLLGIGADNFQQQYLVHGRSEETPHYPHSVELRTLAQTGLVGRAAGAGRAGRGAAGGCARAAQRRSARALGGGGGAGGLRLLGGPRLVRLVLGVRGARRAGVRAARARLRARAGAT